MSKDFLSILLGLKDPGEEAELKKALEKRNADIEILRSFCPIGGTFKYLGATMRVTDYASSSPYSIYKVVLCCDYIDLVGEIHSVSFNVGEVERMIEERATKERKEAGK